MFFFQRGHVHLSIVRTSKDHGSVSSFETWCGYLPISKKWVQLSRKESWSPKQHKKRNDGLFVFKIGHLNSTRVTRNQLKSNHVKIIFTFTYFLSNVWSSNKYHTFNGPTRSALTPFTGAFNGHGFHFQSSNLAFHEAIIIETLQIELA